MSECIPRNAAKLHEAVTKKNLDEIRRYWRAAPELIDYAPHPIKRTAMHLAARSGRSEAIALLHELGSLSLDFQDINGYTPMHYAAMHGSVNAIQKLIQLGSKAADVFDINGRIPLGLAMHLGNCAAVEFFCGLGRSFVDSPEVFCGSPLHFAVFLNSFELTRIVHCYGTEKHFECEIEDNFYPAQERSAQPGFGARVGSLYFSRSLMEVLFFTLNK